MSMLQLAALWLLQAALPQPVGYVNDFAGILSADSKARIEAIANDVRTKSGGEIVVVTLPDLGGRPIEEVALRIGREWKVGQGGAVGTQGRNAGTIILVAPRERMMRIEVGSGAEGFLTDGTTGAIQDEALAFFRANDYARGIELMTLRVAERYASEYNFTLAPSAVPQAPAQPRGRRPTGGINPVVLFIIFMIVVSMMGGGRRRRGCLPIFIPMGGGGWHHRGGGGFGGGFGGGGFGGFGGGGGFSGGGSSRGW